MYENYNDNEDINTSEDADASKTGDTSKDTDTKSTDTTASNAGSYDSRTNTPSYYPYTPSYTPYERVKRSSTSKFFMILSLVLVLALAVSAVYIMSTHFKSMLQPSTFTPGEGSLQDPTSDETNTDEQETQTDALKNGEFKLETVTSEEHYKLSSVYAMTKDSVVEITTESMQTGSFMQQYVTTGAGSGVIISDDGYIVTNHHVIDGASKIMVTLTNGSTYEAALVGTDAKTDLAVLKIEEAGLSPAKLGVSSKMLVGEDILVIGNPLGSLGGSLSDGIISAAARQIAIDGKLMTLIQTNAAVNPGNSGGAMFNMSGELIGIVNAKYTDEAVEGIGFAIPIDSAKPIIEDLTNYGYVKGRTNLGLTIEYGTYISSVGSANWVTAVSEGSDAAKAGIKYADMIYKVNGQEFANSELLNAYLDTLAIGDTVSITVKRYTATSTSFMWGTQYKEEELSFEITLTEFTK